MMSLLPFHWHLVEVVVLLLAALLHRVVVTNARQRRLALVGLAALLVVTIWPVGDLAASVSLSIATLQRLVIMLFVAPMLLLATPIPVIARLTRRAPVDWVTRHLAHPGLAMIVVTVMGTLTLSVPIVDWGARSSIGRDLIVLSSIATGVLLWLPALGLLPGAKRLSAAARAGYIFASALVVTSLSFVWIFAQHPLYPALEHQYALLHVTPIFDQQLAGFVAKLGCYLPMWIVAFTVFFHAEDQGVPVEDTPLHWADVERELERVDRQRARTLRRHRPQ